MKQIYHLHYIVIGFITYLFSLAISSGLSVDIANASERSTGQSINKQLQNIRKKTNNNTVTLVFDAGSDTQIQIAKDLVDVMEQNSSAKSQGIRILPILSKGGAQNAKDIMFLKGVDIGIIQTDILAHLRGENWALYKDIYKNIKYISKLYHAEWHVVGKKNIKDMRELKGKRVNISSPESGTNIMSRNIFELLGVKVNYTTYSNTIALEKLKRGEIDAMTTVGGAPLKNFVSITEEDDLHLIPATFFSNDQRKIPLLNVLEFFYFPAYLTHQQYPNLILPGKKIPTVANGVVLAMYNWDQSKNSTRKRKISNFIKHFIANFHHFKEPGRHKKWHETNIAATIVEWQKANDVARFLKTEKQR